MLTKQEFINLFPYKQIRQNQLDVLNKLYDNWDKYDNFIIEAPTGTGKSAIGYTTCSLFSHSMILTGTKLLQDQYISEFPNLHCIKGKSSYRCNIEHISCDKAICERDSKFKKDDDCKYCSYKLACNKLDNDGIILTNYASFIANTRIRTRKNDVCIFDEAHTLENTLVEVQAFIIDRQKLVKQYDLLDFLDKLMDDQDFLEVAFLFTGLKFDENNFKHYKIGNKEYPHNVAILKSISQLLTFKVNHILSSIELSDDELKTKDEILKLNSKLKSYIDNYNNPNWIVDIKDKDTMIIQPLEVKDIFKNLTKNIKKNIFMSATIISVDQFIKTFGLEAKRTACIRVPETFDPLRSPIISYPVGKMNYSSIDKTIPNIINAVNNLLQQHKNEKGIILTNNYKITEAIVNGVKDKRLIHKKLNKYYDMNNQEMYEQHINSKTPTVLISPSMNTGVDLPDDMSRFQIIVKMPFDSLGDKRIKYKADTDKDWYNTQMIRTFVQSCGRSVRNNKDWCITYVLDSSFMYYVNTNKNKFTSNFQKRITTIDNFDLQHYKDYLNK